MDIIEANKLLDRIGKEAQGLQDAKIQALGDYYVVAFDPFQDRNIQFTENKDFDEYLAALELIRKERRIPNGDTIIEVTIDIPGSRGYQWELYGPWLDSDRDVVEATLLKCDYSDYRNHWELYDGAYGNTYRFIAKRFTWDIPPFCHANTAKELAKAIREYYEK